MTILKNIKALFCILFRKKKTLLVCPCVFMEDIQYRCVTPSVCRRNLFSTVEGMQYEPVTSSVWRRVCSMDLSHYRYGVHCVVQDYRNCSRGSWWLYLSGKNYILQTILLLPRFHPTVVESRCC